MFLLPGGRPLRPTIAISFYSCSYKNCGWEIFAKITHLFARRQAWQPGTFALVEMEETSLEDVAAALGETVIRETLGVVPAWAANAVVVDDRGIDDPSRNQDLARPVGTC